MRLYVLPLILIPDVPYTLPHCTLAQLAPPLSWDKFLHLFHLPASSSLIYTISKGANGPTHSTLSPSTSELTEMNLSVCLSIKVA